MQLLIPEIDLIFSTTISVLVCVLLRVALLEMMRNDLWMWRVLIVLIPFPGAIIYFFSGRQRKIRK